MTGEWIRFGFSALFVMAGLAAVIAAVVGSVRYKDPLCAMHAAAMIDTMGLLSFVLASAVAFGFGVENVKMVLTVCFMWMTSPINSHLLSRLEFMLRSGSRKTDITLPEEKRES